MGTRLVGIAYFVYTGWPKK